MAKNNTGKYVILAAAGVAAIYFLTRRQTTVPPPSSPQVAQQQLQQWAQTQTNPNLLQQVISNLSLDDIMDFWDRVFGKGDENDSYSGGGSDTGGYYGGDYILV